jgi:penicillin-binding protein-related factor A (putative recombinase)
VQQTEKILENQILEYLQSQGIWTFKVKTTGTFDPKTRGFRRTGKWYKKGVSDILGIYKGKFLAIEVKIKGSYPAPNQRIFLQDVLNNGGISFVARSIEDVEQALLKQEKSDASISQ